MGNQMFQFACGKALSVKHGVPLILDHSYLERKQPRNITKRNYELTAFGIEMKASKYLLFKIYFSSFLARIFSHKSFYKLINEKSPYEANTKFPYYNNLIINGYFQSESYFENFSNIIKGSFKFIEPGYEHENLINKIRKHKNSVSILIRRDDYLNFNIENILSINYYQSAIEYIKLNVPNPYFFIFTIGDTEWTKENFQNFENSEIIENENPNLVGFEKMRAMSLCCNNIIANSSFGWWSAWLNENPEKIVIAPKNWINNDIINNKISKSRYPKNWIKI
jgi:hypothetical protein